eukprot:589144-Hanusia_phi.AAC.2
MARYLVEYHITEHPHPSLVNNVNLKRSHEMRKVESKGREGLSPILVNIPPLLAYAHGSSKIMPEPWCHWKTKSWRGRERHLLACADSLKIVFGALRRPNDPSVGHVEQEHIAGSGDSCRVAVSAARGPAASNIVGFLDEEDSEDEGSEVFRYDDTGMVECCPAARLVRPRCHPTATLILVAPAPFALTP